MSKTVIKNSKVLVRRVVDDLPFGIASCDSLVEGCSSCIIDCISILNEMAPYYGLPSGDVARLLRVLLLLYNANQFSRDLSNKLKSLHKSLNPESLGLEVID